MSSNIKSPSRKALGDFIRTYRGKIKPHQKGLPESLRRRTPGLRREELAQLCGISSTWLTWIEQGRPQTISAETLDRLAKILELSKAERNYLFTLAQKKDPYIIQPNEAVPPILKKIIDQIKAPSYVLDKSWNAIAWNNPASKLFKDWLNNKNGPKLNLLRYTFYDETAKTLIPDWEIRVRRLIAEFRADSSQYPEDPEILHLIHELSKNSPEFRKYWEIHEVIDREGGLRSFHHTKHALINFEQITLKVSHRPQLKLIILMSPS
jgi:transcriptional regulator with XRE-family HTH domain